MSRKYIYLPIMFLGDIIYPQKEKPPRKFLGDF
jgi:hypothetical protein